MISSLSDTQVKIMLCLSRDKPKTTEEISRILSLETNYIRCALNDLFEFGYVNKEKCHNPKTGREVIQWRIEQS